MVLFSLCVCCLCCLLVRLFDIVDLLVGYVVNAFYCVTEVGVFVDFDLIGW